MQSSKAERMAGELPHRISAHMAAPPELTRVVSRKPVEARRCRSSAGTLPCTAARAQRAATMCGM